MKTNIFIILLGLIIFASCEKNDRIMFSSDNEAVFFKDVSGDRDSITLSLATKPTGNDTLWLNVNLIGTQLSVPSNYSAVVVEEMTTAEEGLHYEILKERYTFPADTFKSVMPVVLMKGDPALKKNPVVLTVKLVTDELRAGYADQQLVRIVFSDIFITPSEDYGYYSNMNYFIKLFGEYSQVKHQAIFEYLGEDLPTKKYAMYYRHKYRDLASWKYFEWGKCAKYLLKYYADNIVLDENGVRIETWKIQG